MLHGLFHKKSTSPADRPWGAATSLLSLFSSGFLFKTTLPNFLFLSTILLPSFISWTCQWLFFFFVFIEFVTIFLPLYVSWTFGHMACGTVVSWPGREPTPCLGRQSLNHWTTREGPLSMAFTIVCLSQIAIPLLFLKKHIFAGKVTFIFKVNTNFICFMKRYI